VTRVATDRLTNAFGLTLVGALFSVLFGMPEVALFVAPWVVLALLGLLQHRTPVVLVGVELSKERLLEDDDAELTVTVTSTEDGIVRLAPVPQATFGMSALDVESYARVEAVAATKTQVVDFLLPAVEWGVHDLGRVQVDFVSRYGLFRMIGESSAARVIRVHPAPTRLRELLAPWLVRRVPGTHRSRESARGIEYADLRPFTTGDSVRDINWRASARSTELWVSQRHPERATDLVLLVDSFVETGHDIRTVFGAILDASIALSENHLGASDRVGMVEFGGVVRWIAPGTGRMQLQQLTDALLATGLYMNAANKTLPELPTRALPPRSFVVALTPLLDQRFVDAVFEARGRGHDVAVIECVPAADSTSPDATETEDRLRQTQLVGTALWQAERTLLRDQMAEQGIAVAQWDGESSLDLALGELVRRRQRSVRAGGR